MWTKLSEILKTYKISYHPTLQGLHNFLVADYLKPQYEIHTLLVWQKYPPVSRIHKHNKKYFKVNKEKHISILDEKVQGRLMTENNALIRKWDKMLAEQSIPPHHPKYHLRLDEEVLKIRKKYKKELYDEVLREHAYLRLLDIDSTLEYQDDEFIEKALDNYLANEKNKLSLHRYITKSRHHYSRERIFNHQVSKEFLPLLGEGYEDWSQIYVVIDHEKKEVFHIKGRSRGSSSRHQQGYFAHLFAELKNQGKAIKSHVLFFNQNGEFFTYSENNLILIKRDLIGNYAIDEASSQKIISATKQVRHANDLSFDLFINTGIKLEWGDEET